MPQPQFLMRTCQCSYIYINLVDPLKIMSNECAKVKSTRVVSWSKVTELQRILLMGKKKVKTVTPIKPNQVYNSNKKLNTSTTATGLFCTMKVSSPIVFVQLHKLQIKQELIKQFYLFTTLFLQEKHLYKMKLLWFNDYLQFSVMALVP